MDVKEIGKVVLKAAKKNLPTILSWTGIATGGAAVVLAAMERDKQLEYRDDILKEKEELTIWDEVKCCGKAYWKAGLLYVVSAACGYGSNKENMKRNAALVATLKLSEEANKDLENAIKKTFGDSSIKEVKDKEIEESLRTNPVKNVTVIETGKGNELFFDARTKLYFRSSSDAVDNAFNAIEAALKNDEMAVNDLLINLNEPVLSYGYTREFTWPMGGYTGYNKSYKRDDTLDEPVCVLYYELPFEQQSLPF